MLNTNSHDYAMSDQQQKKHQQHIKQTTTTTNGNPTTEQAGSQNIPQKVIELLDSLETDMTSVYISYTGNESKTTCNYQMDTMGQQYHTNYLDMPYIHTTNKSAPSSRKSSSEIANNAR